MPISVPKRSELIQQLAQANQFAWLLLIVQAIVTLVLIAFIDWNWFVKEPILATVAIGVMVGPFGYSWLLQSLVRKTRIQDLRESTRFGQYDKHKLMALYRDTLNRLQLPDGSLSVYIVADRTLNAAAGHIGLGKMFQWLNGIYLNRQVLHKLEPNEVQDIIGHELGHYYKHYLVIDRFRVVTLSFGSLLGVLAAQKIGLAGWLSYLILAGIPATVWFISSLPHARNSMAIEFLCDDCGAQVGGILPSVQGLLKLGQTAEVERAVFYQAVLSKAAGRLNPQELIETVMNNVPYGYTTREEVETQVRRELDKKAANQSMSVGGLLRYMWNSDSDAEAAEELERKARQFAKLQDIPRLNWESVLQDPAQIVLNDARLLALVQLIETNPDLPLFRLPEEVNPLDQDNPGTHPPLKNRILYLWYNRAEIETQIRRR